jgi:parvulin-like peptidyl-prolyl isomerase
VGAVVVAVFFAFFAFVAFVFFVFSVFEVSVVVVSCANTGIVSENAIANVNNIAKSFFISGLDLLRDYFLLSLQQVMGHLSRKALNSPSN